MVVSSPIADMLTRIRNANALRYTEVAMPTSKVKAQIASILKSEGYINDYTVDEKTLTLSLKYGDNKERVISGLRCISKPGLRVYAKAEEVPTVLNGLGIAILSTSKGIMTDKQARKDNVGGEVLAYIW